MYSYTLQNLLIILKTLITFLEFTKFSDKCTAIHAMYTERRGIIEWIWCFKVCGYPASWIYNNFMIIVDGIFVFNQRIKSTIFVRYHQKLNIFFLLCVILWHVWHNLWQKKKKENFSDFIKFRKIISLLLCPFP